MNSEPQDREQADLLRDELRGVRAASLHPGMAEHVVKTGRRRRRRRNITTVLGVAAAVALIVPAGLSLIPGRDLVVVEPPASASSAQPATGTTSATIPVSPEPGSTATERPEDEPSAPVPDSTPTLKPEPGVVGPGGVVPGAMAKPTGKRTVTLTGDYYFVFRTPGGTFCKLHRGEVRCLLPVAAWGIPNCMGSTASDVTLRQGTVKATCESEGFGSVSPDQAVKLPPGDQQLEATIESAYDVDYGTVMTEPSGVTCLVVSESLRCRDAKGVGFALSKAQYRFYRP